MTRCNKCNDKKFTMRMEDSDKPGWVTFKFEPCECTVSNDTETEQLKEDLQRMIEKNNRLSSDVQHWRSEAMKAYRVLESIKDRIDAFDAPFYTIQCCADCIFYSGSKETPKEHRCFRTQGAKKILTEYEVHTKRPRDCPLKGNK